MQNTLIYWDMYEIQSTQEIHGVKLRGRIRKYSIQIDKTLIVENATDSPNTVRFVVKHGDDITQITTFLKEILEDVTVRKVLEKVQNPILSKLKVNDEQRYKL